jgi:hypothetical protein
MSNTPIDQVEPGMIVANTVYGRNGTLVLVQAGTALNEQHIAYLRRWNITEIEIFGGKMEAVETVAAAFDDSKQTNSTDFEKAAMRFFKHCDLNHPAVATLFGEFITKLVTEQIMREAMGG